MKYITTLFCFCNLFVFFVSFAQNQQENLSILSSKRHTIYRDSKKINKNQFIALLEQQNNTYGFQKFNSSRDYHTVAVAAFLAGFAGVGYEAGGRLFIASKKPNNITFAGAGLAFGIGFLLEHIAVNKLKKSIKSYNTALQNPKTSFLKPKFDYNIAANEIGIVLKF